MVAPSTAPHVAIVGVTGAVGQEFLAILAQRDFPVRKLKLLASARSAGKTVQFRDQAYAVEQLSEDSFRGVDLALFSAGGSISKQFAPLAAEAGAVVVDNSSAFRMTEGMPLIVPEVNLEVLRDSGIKVGSKAGIIANPNCSTIIMIVAVTPLHRAAGVRRLVVSTYQAASGAGAAGMAELERQTRQVLSGDAPTCEVFDQPYAFNIFSHDTPIGTDGYNSEELKMVYETRKIWGQGSSNGTAITATCIRVPVMRAHAESINLTLEHPLSEAEAKDILSRAPGVSIRDDRDHNRFPTPLDATGRDDVLVGRIRRDLSQDQDDSGKGRGLDLFVCGDQLRKGAALNAVQIAEMVL